MAGQEMEVVKDAVSIIIQHIISGFGMMHCKLTYSCGLSL